MAISFWQNEEYWVGHSGPSSAFPARVQRCLAFVNRLTRNLHICVLCVLSYRACALDLSPAAFSEIYY